MSWVVIAKLNHLNIFRIHRLIVSLIAAFDCVLIVHVQCENNFKANVKSFVIFSYTLELCGADFMFNNCITKMTPMSEQIIER